MQQQRGYVLRWLFVLLYLPVYAGFWFHRSVRPVLLGYSLDHLLLLAFLGLVFLLPWGVASIKRRLGPRQSSLLFLVLGISLLVIYSLTSLIYYNWIRCKPPFDPYLQARPLPVDMDRLRELIEHRNDPKRPLVIVILGGSTSVHYPAVLERELKKLLSEQPFEIINLAQNSYSIKHALIRFGTHFDQCQPNIVIGLFGINEMVRSFSAETQAVGEYDDEWSHFFAFTINAVRLPTLEHLIWDRLQYSWYRQLRVKEVDLPLAQFRSIRPYEQHLHRLAQWIKLNGGQGLFLTQPTLYKANATSEEKNKLSIQITQCLARQGYFHQEYPSVSSLALAMQVFNQTTVKVAQLEGVPVLDLDAAIPKNLNHFSDDCHWTEQGTEQVAREIAKALIDKGLLKRRVSPQPPP